MFLRVWGGRFTRDCKNLTLQAFLVANQDLELELLRGAGGLIDTTIAQVESCSLTNVWRRVKDGGGQAFTRGKKNEARASPMLVGSPKEV